MKKILVVLLILAVSAGTVFAQVSGDPALKFSGDVKTGLVLHSDEAVKAPPTLGFWHDDAGPIRLNLTGTYTAENHGAWFTLLFKPQTTYDTNGATTGGGIDVPWVAIDTGGVYGEFLNDMVKFSVGITGSKWGTGGHLDKNSGDSNLAVEIKPIEGLNFGFTLGDRTWLNGVAAGYRNDVGGTASPYTAGDMFKTFGGGVSYKSSFIDIFAGGAARPVTSGGYGDGNRAYLDVFIRPIGDPLTIEVGGIAYSLGEFSEETITKARIHGTLFGTYKTDADNAGSLTVFGGGDLAYHLRKDAAIGWKGTLGVGYQLSDPLKIGLEGNIQSSAKDTAGGTKADQGFIEDNGAGYVHKDADTAIKVEVKPNVTYKFASNAEIGFFYKLKVHAFDDDNLEHQVQVNFGWTF